jgi:hypothetical protein
MHFEVQAALYQNKQINGTIAGDTDSCVGIVLTNGMNQQTLLFLQRTFVLEASTFVSLLESTIGDDIQV